MPSDKWYFWPPQPGDTVLPPLDGTPCWVRLAGHRGSYSAHWNGRNAEICIDYPSESPEVTDSVWVTQWRLK
jgi:hypothetical protein